jgi:hypothetical protein
VSSTKLKIDPRAASPKLKPKFAEVEVSNHNGTGNARSAKIDQRAAALKPKPKFAEIEVANHNGKGNTSPTKFKIDPRAAAAYASWRASSPRVLVERPPTLPNSQRKANTAR